MWLKRVLFAMELIVWIILVYQLAEKSLNKQPVLSIVMTLLLLFIISWTFWYVLRDYLAGIYIRISGRFKLNETIAFDDPQGVGQVIKGEIIRLADQNIVLETQNHTIIELPYNKIFNRKMERHVQSVDEELSLLIEIKSIKDREVFTQEVKKRILELPWINHKQEPKLIIQKQQDSKTYLEIKVILVDKKYRNRVEEVLIESFGK
ncbi:MAG: hypothetical protein ABFS35_20250 [Bacteroidota bacterium]